MGGGVFRTRTPLSRRTVADIFGMSRAFHLGLMNGRRANDPAHVFLVLFKCLARVLGTCHLLQM